MTRNLKISTSLGALAFALALTGAAMAEVTWDDIANDAETTSSDRP